MVRRRTGGVIMGWKEAIKDLPVILKAHIYEPKIEDVAKASYEAGRKAERERIGGELEDIRCSASGEYLPRIEQLIRSIKE